MSSLFDLFAFDRSVFLFPLIRSQENLCDDPVGRTIRDIVNAYAVIECVELISPWWKGTRKSRVGRVVEQVDGR